jgi:hypothetical protein
MIIVMTEAWGRGVAVGVGAIEVVIDSFHRGLL